MRAFFRPVATLVVAPLLFVAALGHYWGTTTTTGRNSLWLAQASEVRQIYGDFTLPALAVILVVLLPVDLALRRAGIGLLTVVASPLIAVLAALAAQRFVSEPHVQHWANAVWLFFTYGLTWGLTIRDPRTVMAS